VARRGAGKRGHELAPPRPSGTCFRPCPVAVPVAGRDRRAGQLSNLSAPLNRGDEQYADGDWINAVREYYSALESALKYALREEAVEYAEANALKKLSGQVAAKGVIPINYQALFGFTDSIRSPRSHGSGPVGDGVREVEIGRAEALLIGNHVRTLLVYLGHRPQL
jgi:hypothetical protein